MVPAQLLAGRVAMLADRRAQAQDLFEQLLARARLQVSVELGHRINCASPRTKLGRDRDRWNTFARTKP
jgi:hypothetical protein